MARTVDDFAPKISSGIDAIDREWGGLYGGGTYLAYGRVSNGRGLVALLFSQIGAALGEKTLYVSSERSKDLIIQAASIGFDIRRAHRLGVFKLVRTSQLLRSQMEKSSAGFSPFERLISQIRSYGPARLVVSDAMAFAGGLDPLSSDFRDAYAAFLEQIEALGTTLMVTLPEPTNDVARRFTEFVMSLSTAAIYVGRENEKDDSEQYQITLIPQIGHITRKRTINWSLVELVEKAEQVDATYRTLQGRIAASGGAFLLPAPRKSELAPASVPSVQPSAVPAPTVVQSPRPEVVTPEVVTPESQTRPPAPTEQVAPEDDDHVVPHKTLEDLAVESEDVVHSDRMPSLIDRVLDDVLRTPLSYDQVKQTPASVHAIGSADSVRSADPVHSAATSGPDDSADGSDTVNAREAVDTVHSTTSDDAIEAVHPSQTIDAVEPTATSHRNWTRADFTDQLQSYFERAADQQTDFLMVAMRVDNEVVSAREFSLLADTVSWALRDKDAFYTDPRRGRLVLLMPESSADQAQELFAEVKDRLRRDGAAGADAILRRVSAIVVPNGNPFGGAVEFLAYVLDNE